jgi:flagellar motor switch/type III secretory pathway protein FliN
MTEESHTARFADIPIAVEIQIGVRMMTLAAIEALDAGSLVQFERPINEPLDLLAGNVPIASAAVMSAADRVTARIVQIDAGVTDRAR